MKHCEEHCKLELPNNNENLDTLPHLFYYKSFQNIYSAFFVKSFQTLPVVIEQPDHKCEEFDQPLQLNRTD